MLALRLPHLVVDNAQVLVQVFNVCLQVERLREHLLTIRRLIVHVRIAHHLPEEPVIFSVGERVCSLAHLLRKNSVKLVFNCAKLAQKCALLQFDVV